ncbi:13157_t:CDS:2, partial [Rhizophagus irregularis]
SLRGSKVTKKSGSYDYDMITNVHIKEWEEKINSSIPSNIQTYTTTKILSTPTSTINPGGSNNSNISSIFSGSNPDETISEITNVNSNLTSDVIDALNYIPNNSVSEISDDNSSIDIDLELPSSNTDVNWEECMK